MIDLARLRSEQLRVSVVIRGQSYEATPLSAADSRKVHAAIPRPERVTEPDGRGGFRIRDTDPRQQEADAWHGLTVMAAEILVGTGTVAADDGPEKLRAAAEEFLGLAGEHEVSTAWRAMREAAVTRRDDARKN